MIAPELCGVIVPAPGGGCEGMAGPATRVLPSREHMCY
jgi:hypothetical protein